MPLHSDYCIGLGHVSSKDRSLRQALRPHVSGYRMKRVSQLSKASKDRTDIQYYLKTLE